MVFWMAILSGVLFVWLAVRMGFYDTWVLFFNVAISIYISVFLTPWLVEVVPPAGRAAGYHVALCMILLGGGCFALLQGLSYVFLTGQFHIPFPRLFDVLLSGLLGFITGFLLLSFAALAATTTPLADHKTARVFTLARETRQANLLCLTRCGDVIHAWTRADADSPTTETAVRTLLEMKIAAPPVPPSELPPAEPQEARTPSWPRRRTAPGLD